MPGCSSAGFTDALKQDSWQTDSKACSYWIKISRESMGSLSLFPRRRTPNGLRGGASIPLLIDPGAGVLRPRPDGGIVPPEGSGNAGARPPTSSAMGEEAAAPAQSGKPPISTERSLLDWLRASLSQQEDPDGPINTDRPTFTPANTVVPGGRLQFESGFTFNNEVTTATRTPCTTFLNSRCATG